MTPATDADGWPTEPIPVTSSNVAAIRWRPDPEPGRLEVTFLGGSVYQYEADESVYDEMFAAASKGRFVWEVLRRRGLPYARVS